MDLIIAFGVFMVLMIVCIAMNLSVVIALIGGFICFFAVAVARKYKPRHVFKMSLEGVKTSWVVLKLLFLIGCLTALWRASGTIAFFVYYGMDIITPQAFIIIAFLLTALMSYFLGSSFGVTSTAGVMLMILARSGGVNEFITAGAILSGAYFGDRSSPVSSSAFLTATMSGVSPEENKKWLLKTGVFPLGVTGIIFTVLSFKNPISGVSQSVMESLSGTYDISLWAAVPAIVLLVLPWMKVSVSNTILISAITSFVVAVIFQNQSPAALVTYMVTGYELDSAALGDVMAGGGVISMVEVMIVVILSSSYAGIFEETGMLNSLKDKMDKAATKIGLFGLQLVFSVLSVMIFCNQTIATILSVQLLGDTYKRKGASNEELAMDIGNSLITICGLVPWSVACAVPLSMLDIGNGAIPWCIFLYMNPICYIFTKRLFFKKR